MSRRTARLLATAVSLALTAGLFAARPHAHENVAVRVRTASVGGAVIDPRPAEAAIEAAQQSAAVNDFLTADAHRKAASRATYRAASSHSHTVVHRPPVVVVAVDGPGPPDSDFDRLAQCESGGRWDLNTGNGYYGGVQFSASTWHGYGGPDLPNQHTREEQIMVARRVWRARGWAPWPSCSRQVGLR